MTITLKTQDKSLGGNRFGGLELNIEGLAWLRYLPQVFKLRIVSLLLLAALGGAFLGAGSWPGAGAIILLLVTGGLAASGASALNQYLERNSDAEMHRTRGRPLVTGAIPYPKLILVIGLLFVIAPSIAVVSFNPALAFFLALGAIIYVGFYTLWLKPRSLLNIVIGGAAGSAAVLSGAAVVNAWNTPWVWALALLVFSWTPTHFWSLALLYQKDYVRANTPMLPTQTKPRKAALWILLHTLATTIAGMALAVSPGLGMFYFIVALIAGLDLLRKNIQLLRHPSAANARIHFLATNLFLLLILLAIFVDITL